MRNKKKNDKMIKIQMTRIRKRSSRTIESSRQQISRRKVLEDNSNSRQQNNKSLKVHFFGIFFKLKKIK